MVEDAAAARQELLDRGVEASELTSFGGQDGSTFFGFAGLDGNSWAVQLSPGQANGVIHEAAAYRVVG